MTLPSSPTAPPPLEPLHAQPTQRSGAEGRAGRRAGTQLSGLRGSFTGPKVQSSSWAAAALPASSRTAGCWLLLIPLLSKAFPDFHAVHSLASRSSPNLRFGTQHLRYSLLLPPSSAQESPLPNLLGPAPTGPCPYPELALSSGVRF